MYAVLLFCPLVFIHGQYYSKEKFIGGWIKESLEKIHYRKIKLDDSVSKKAFPEFLNNIDYSKNFLLKSQVDQMGRYALDMDDQMLSGDHKLLNMAVRFFRERVGKAESVREKIFKNQFDFKKKEGLELDPEKRSYLNTEEEFEDRWRKIFKNETLNRYLLLIQESDEEKSKNKSSKKPSDKKILAKAHEVVSEKYKVHFSKMLKETRSEQLEKFFNAIAEIYDPHTSYLPPRRKEDFDIDMTGSLEGIGAVLEEDGSYIKVSRIVPGGAAWRQKELQANDIILTVSDKGKKAIDLVGFRVIDAVRHIRGKKGTEVTLTVKRVDGSIKKISIVRDVVKVSESFAKSSIVRHKKLKIKVGYIQLLKFYRDFGSSKKNCTEDVLTEIKRLKKNGVDGIIFDLRNNGGGALEDARKMSGLFIKKGPIVQVKGHTGQVDMMTDEDNKIFYDGPLILLVNRFSASASEIFAGAMQDYRRGVIVGGEYSHGKGTVQMIVEINPGPFRTPFSGTLGVFKITTQKFYRITGGSTQYKGVTPDVILPDPMGYLENREQDLDHSLPWGRIGALNYSVWKPSYNTLKLKQKSARRVAKSKDFQKIVESVKYLVGRRDDTYVSLNKNEVVATNKKNKEMIEKYKLDSENKNILVSHYESSLRSYEKIKAGEEKRWKEEFKERRKEWLGFLRKDPFVEESLHIMNDMISSFKKVNRTDARR